jgi:hypothetical protein
MRRRGDRLWAFRASVDAVGSGRPSMIFSTSTAVAPGREVT